ncbi:MAG: hypothetical protein RR540_03595, partial [Oscillospiraceae bacterium]
MKYVCTSLADTNIFRFWGGFERVRLVRGEFVLCGGRFRTAVRFAAQGGGGFERERSIYFAVNGEGRFLPLRAAAAFGDLLFLRRKRREKAAPA